MSGIKYEVNPQTVEGLLSLGTAQFQVPVFQRKYAWGAEEIGQLMGDLFDEGSQGDLPYFLGSIVLARQNSSEGLAPDLVLDGQQRLTTLSLLIAALIHKMKAEGNTDAGEHKRYLNFRRLKGKPMPKILLQPEDAKLFEVLIDRPEQWSEHKNTRLGIAVGKIFELLDDFSSSSPQYKDSVTPSESMLSRILYDVELVKITAPSERDAFRLFETLNDRGLALSAADLIKNKIFSRCKDEIEDAVESWGNLLRHTKEDDVVNYLRTYWIAFKGFTRKRGLYDIYKNHIDRFDPTAATLFVIELEELASLYAQISTPNPNSGMWGADVAFGLDRLNSLRARSCRPALLAFAKFRPQDMKNAVRLCESITIRYSVVGDKNPNHLERMYSELAKILRENVDPWPALRSSAVFDEVPKDEEFQSKLSKMNVTTTTPGWREVLDGLNRFLADSELRVDRASRVHIEHILPQTPRAAALAEAGLSIDEAAALTSRIGNLTLLSGKRNIQASNLSFSQKKKYYKDSDVYMTRELAPLEIWGRNEIEDRSNRLAEAAVKLFPHPQKIIG